MTAKELAHALLALPEEDQLLPVVCEDGLDPSDKIEITRLQKHETLTWFTTRACRNEPCIEIL